MGTLVGVNKYAIKMRKSKLWTGLFSCPLISFITEILLLNNISVNNLSSVFRSACVNNSITGGGCPPAWPRGRQPHPGEGLLQGYLPHRLPHPALSRDNARHLRVPQSSPSLRGGCLQPVKEQVSVLSDQQMRDGSWTQACTTGSCCLCPFLPAPPHPCLGPRWTNTVTLQRAVICFTWRN